MKGIRWIRLASGLRRPLRKAVPRTMEFLRRSAGRIGDGVTDGFRTLEHRAGTALNGNAALSRARKSLGRRLERTGELIRTNPYALPLVGLGGTALAVLALLAQRRRRARRTRGLLQEAFRSAAVIPVLRVAAGRALGFLLRRSSEPRKPRIFRAVTVRW